MTRNEQLVFCKVCVNKASSMEKGIICSLTSEQATFQTTCPDFIEDEKIKKNLAFEKKKKTKDEKSTAITLLVSSAVAYFVISFILEKMNITFIKPIILNVIALILLRLGVISLVKLYNVKIKKTDINYKVG
jgi:Na+/alanine symporter